MSDQHAAAALTAAAVIATILVARAAVLHQGSRRRLAPVTRLVRGRIGPRAGKAASSAAPLPDDAFCVVREAEQHVRHCWQRLHTRTEPPECPALGRSGGPVACRARGLPGGAPAAPGAFADAAGDAVWLGAGGGERRALPAPGRRRPGRRARRGPPPATRTRWGVAWGGPCAAVAQGPGIDGRRADSACRRERVVKASMRRGHHGLRHRSRRPRRPGFPLSPWRPPRTRPCRGRTPVEEGLRRSAVSRASLQTDLAHALSRNSRLASRVKVLEQRLSTAFGEQVREESGLGASVDVDHLQRRISTLEQELAERNRELEKRAEELEAARQANRELTRALNQASPGNEPSWEPTQPAPRTTATGCPRGPRTPSRGACPRRRRCPWRGLRPHHEQQRRLRPEQGCAADPAERLRSSLRSARSPPPPPGPEGARRFPRPGRTGSSSEAFSIFLYTRNEQVKRKASATEGAPTHRGSHFT